MMKKLYPLTWFLLVQFSFCKQKVNGPPQQLLDEINLKRGQIITCGSPDLELGSAELLTSCSEQSKNDFNLGVRLLHSFEYDEAEKAFAKVVDQNPDCAMAYWGIAMSNFHALWTPPTQPELIKGQKAIQIARSLETSKREQDYIAAIASFYDNWGKTDHHTRCLNFENAMEKLYKAYPEDKEAAIFYALALNAAADPSDKSFSKQKKAGKILEALYLTHPKHPGIVHYIIHTYDSPELAQQGLDAARKYASIAPSSAHALHMPSHIFTRLGLWDECISSNLVSVSSAKCYAENTGIKGHWDEELHGLDYLMYGYLQRGQNDSARRTLDYASTIKEVHPTNFKVAYAFAAMPSRYLLENKMWKEASNLEVTPANFSWTNYPWQEAIIHFTRALGATRTRNMKIAKEEVRILNRLHDTLLIQKDVYKANQVAIQMKTAEAWIQLNEGKHSEALTLMQTAADMEDKTEKHPVTPSEVLPAHELLADMFMEMNKPLEALGAYKADLQKHPNRFNALYGAGLAAEKSGNAQEARKYFEQLLAVVGEGGSERSEIRKAKGYLNHELKDKRLLSLIYL